MTSFRIATLPAAVTRGCLRRSRERAAIARLDQLSDATLRDIGLTRGSIREAVRYGRP